MEHFWRRKAFPVQSVPHRRSTPGLPRVDGVALLAILSLCHAQFIRVAAGPGPLAVRFRFLHFFGRLCRAANAFLRAVAGGAVSVFHNSSCLTVVQGARGGNPEIASGRREG